jgi:hypothetical protein
MAFEERENDRLQSIGLAKKQAIDNATTDWGIKFAKATPDQRLSLIEEARDSEEIDVDGEDGSLSPEQMDFANNIMLFKSLGKDTFNALISPKGKEKEKTAHEKDFDTYIKLKETNPEQARVFGAASGFIKDDKKRLFKIADGVKYFSDGTEKPVGDDEPVKSEDMKESVSHKKALSIIDKAREGQLKNAGFALTLNDGLNVVNGMIDNGYDPMSASWVNKYLAGTTLGNLSMTEEDQIFSGSVEQMINAIARRETGAAITEFEKKDFFNRYMPVAGDKPARIKQKRSALQRQFKSIRGQSGSVYDAVRVTQQMGDDAEITQADYDKLPQGAEYKLGGKTYIKGQ